MRPGGVPRRCFAVSSPGEADAAEAEGWQTDTDISSFFEILENDEENEQPYAAYNQGFGAYQALGMASFGRCPYPPGQERAWWEQGQEDAREQEEADDPD